MLGVSQLLLLQIFLLATKFSSWHEGIILILKPYDELFSFYVFILLHFCSVPALAWWRHISAVRLILCYMTTWHDILVNLGYLIRLKMIKNIGEKKKRERASEREQTNKQTHKLLLVLLLPLLLQVFTFAFTSYFLRLIMKMFRNQDGHVLI